MRTHSDTPAGMQAAQRAYDNREPDYCSPRRSQRRTVTLPDGSEWSERELADNPADAEEQE